MKVIWTSPDKSRGIEDHGGELFFVWREPLSKVFVTIQTSTHGVMLTRREKQVVMGMLNQLTGKEIANSINMAHRTVKFHKKNIFEKYGVSCQTDLLRKLGYGNVQIQNQQVS